MTRVVTMKHIRNERGIALMTALLLTLISLGIVMAVLYYIIQGMQVSASHRRYKGALEASYGGIDVFTKEIIPQFLGVKNPAGLENVFAGFSPTFSQYSCLSSKLTNAPSGWSPKCGPNPTSVEPTVSPDAIFKLKGQDLQPNFNVYAKVVDTQKGNSDMSGNEALDTGAGVAYGSSAVSPMHVPATYRIEAQAQRETNPLEKAKLSVLYAY
jgi:hypothetical protein